MIKNFENIGLKLIDLIVFVIFVSIFFLVSKISLSNGYDELGALVSHLELDDERFLDAYRYILSVFSRSLIGICSSI